MRFRSTFLAGNDTVSFKEAVLRCLPQEGGLYVPDSVADMRSCFLNASPEIGYQELAAEVAANLFQGDLDGGAAARIAESAFNFEIKLTKRDETFSVLNLYHGTTGVFKDIGASYIAPLLETLTKDREPLLVITAAWGDNGVSIAKAFNGRKNIIPVILYPEGPIRGLDPATFVQNGKGSIIPIQIKCSLNDCYSLRDEVLRDKIFADRYRITSANAINPGRLLPQSFYYLYAFIKLKKTLGGDLIFSVPSGNFGNLIAGLYAWKFGMPVNGFIAAMNINNALGDLFTGKKNRSVPPKKTITPALDISFPSNHERLISFYEESPSVIRNMVFPQIINDTQTIEAMKYAWEKYNIVLDPHSALAFAAARNHAASPDFSGHIVVLATGHPGRHSALISGLLNTKIEVPQRIAKLQNLVEPLAVIPPEVDALENAIISCF
jgi:threonine synthase